MASEGRRHGGARWLPAAVLALATWLVAAGAPARAGEAAEAVELHAPIELVWQVLTDFAAWPRFMPALERVEVEPRSEALLAIRYQTRQMGLEIGFTALTRVDGAALRMESSLDPEGRHDIAAMRSAWQLTPLPDGRVRVELHSDLDSGRPVPGFVERRMLRDSVAETVAALAREVGRRAARS